MVGVAPAARVPPVKVRLLVPVMTSEPPHVVVGRLGAVRPAGNVSMKLIPDSALALGLLIKKLMLVVPPRAMLAAPNDLAIVGGATTVTLAVLLGAPGPL